ncbi:MAG: K(+) efflux antiporter chloroplastic-like [Trebouxia sp. A1-2]|nr:MAG: K(+) efflux antiporter chloroplastic-like [Trebouxia sp. A1-2]
MPALTIRPQVVISTKAGQLPVRASPARAARRSSKKGKQVLRQVTSDGGKLQGNNGASPIAELGLDLKELDSPEELHPLKEALERAKQRVDQSTGIREALEAEAQNLAELAIDAREKAEKARQKVAEAARDVDAAKIVKQKLDADIEQLRHVSSEPSAGEEQAFRADQTVDLGTSEHGTTNAEQSLDAELKDKLQQLDFVSKTIDETETKVSSLGERASASEAAADRAEEEASVAMRSAETGVREEMEAAAVVKETESALSKALAELTFLETSYEEKDFESKAEKAKAKEKAQKEAEIAVRDALAAVNKTVQSPEAEGGLAPTAPGVVELKAEKQRADQEAGLKPKPASKARTTTDEEAKDVATGFQGWLSSNKPIAAFAVVAFVALCVQASGAYDVKEAVLTLLSPILTPIWKVPVLLRSLINKLPLPPVPHGTEGIIETIWLLMTSVVAVPAICKLPGGSPVLGFLAGGALIGPHALGIIQDVEGVRHLAELGVVFLLFNIGLELSLERLRSMQKYVFGMGTAQVVATLVAVAGTAMALANVSGPGAVILGGGLALSSTAVAMQVLQDRGESGSRHGRATFADLAVVVLLMLIPLLAPSDNGALGLSKIAKALGLAAVKAVVAIVTIIAGGRTLLRPLYRRIAALENTEIFAATTLLVVLGTSVMTQIAGLSLALGAFLAGLLVAETEFALQVESDIAPYKGLLMGLFFMTVGMEISVGLFFAEWKTVVSGIVLLIGGKVGVMAAVGKGFGLSLLQSVRAGLLLAAGGEFAFVTFGEAVSHKILPQALVSKLFLIVSLSMALTPFLAEFGQRLGKMFEKSDVKALQPNEGEVEELRGHVVIAGFGRVGQIIAQLLSERLIPFVALDVRSDRVQAGKELDLPVYFGDAGSAAVLHSIGAHRASCAVVTLDSPGANYRTVWALHKSFPDVKVYVRAHDVNHGINLEKAGATAVVPETLEPSLQLASAVLSQLNMPQDEVAHAIQAFRRSHVSELQVLCRNSGSTLGYGFATLMEDADDSSSEEDEPLRPMSLTEAVP